MSDHTRWLIQQMDARRLELRLSWADVADRAGISRDTLHRIRSGEAAPRTLRPLTKRGIDDALEWEPGSFDDASHGRRPTPKGAGRSTSPEEAESYIRDAPSLTPEEKDELVAYLWARRHARSRREGTG